MIRISRLSIKNSLSGQVGKKFTPQDARAVVSTIQSWVAGAAASRAPADRSGSCYEPRVQQSSFGALPAMTAQLLTTRLDKSPSAAELCWLGGHFRDMNTIHLTVGAP